MTAYSVVSDLLLGDVQIGTAIDPQKYVDDAADEMNSRLGMVYNLPLPLVSMPEFVKTILKLVNNRIASGRLLMAAAAAAQSHDLHAYGLSLVTDGYTDLGKILGGEIVLEGAVRRTNGNQALAPTVTNRDGVSAVEAFEDYFYPPAPYYPPYRPPLAQPVWRPGQ